MVFAPMAARKPCVRLIPFAVFSGGMKRVRIARQVAKTRQETIARVSAISALGGKATHALVLKVRVEPIAKRLSLIHVMGSNVKTTVSALLKTMIRPCVSAVMALPETYASTLRTGHAIPILA